MAGRPTYTGGRTVYDGQHAVTGDRHTYTGGKTEAKAEEPKKKGHGFFHRFGSDLLNAAENFPAGVAEIVKATAHDAGQGFAYTFTGGNKGKHPDYQAGKLAKKMLDQTEETLKHPLRHPGDATLLALPLFGQAAKIGEAGAAAKAGASAGEVVKIAVKGAGPGERVLKQGDTELARGHYSHAAGSRVVQKATDKALERGAEKSVRVENLLHRRAAKFNDRAERVLDAKARTAGTIVQKLGEKLTPAELRALRLVAEEVPVERRLGAQEMRKARASGKEAARHQERIDLTKQAMEHLTSDSQGKPVFKPSATKLQRVYHAMTEAVGSREKILEHLNLMDKSAQQAAKAKTAEKVAGEGFPVSEDALHIGNPVERTRLKGRPKVSATGTFGHTQRPSSLKTSTGSSVEHALERNDVTNIVAERHQEAVRLDKIRRVAQRVAKAGEASPRRADDVWVWTDKTVSQEKIPPEVRKYLDNPESIKNLPADEQVSLTEKVKAAFFEKQDWTDPEARAQFEKLAKEGKGVFVPRRLLGEMGKTDYVGTSTGVGHFADVVNNAQKAALVYLKLNYPIIQALSNTAMNLIQQGPFAVKNLTNSFRLDGKIGPEYAAVVDDIMGQGAVLQAAFEGQGMVSRGTQKLAHVMSSKVDTPARRSAFLHEAHAKGYKTDKQIVQLLTDDTKVNDLVEVAQRAKEAIVDYGDLSPFERRVVRKLIFVYPWQKGATKYAAHFVRDHPVQAAALGLLGQRGAEINQEKLGDTPTYLRGAFDVGGGLVNPSGVNFFQTPAQIGEAVTGAVTGNPAQAGALAGFLAPAPGVAAGLLTNRDDIGRPLNSNVAGNLRDLTYGQSQAAALARAAGSNLDVIRKVFGDRTNSKTFPNPRDAYYRFLLGGLYPRRYDKGALNENAARQRVGR